MMSTPDEKEISITLNAVAEDPPGADEFYKAAGRVVIQWGRLENNMEWILRMILEMPESESIRTKKPVPPRAFSGKIDLWQKAFETLPSLAFVRDEALDISRLANGWAPYRNTLVHSLWGDFQSGPPLALYGVMVSFSGGKHHVRQDTVELVALLELGEKLNSLIRRTVALVHHISSLRNVSSRAATI